MTKEEVKELLPIMQAFADGKTIEFFKQGEWMELNDPDFIWSSYKYRIKPEPKYRPFKTKEECWTEMHKHPDFGWIKNKNNGAYSDISTMYNSCGEDRLMIANSSYNLSQALEVFTFTDGTPFGIINK